MAIVLLGAFRSEKERGEPSLRRGVDPGRRVQVKVSPEDYNKVPAALFALTGEEFDQVREVCNLSGWNAEGAMAFLLAAKREAPFWWALPNTKRRALIRMLLLDTLTTEDR